MCVHVCLCCTLNLRVPLISVCAVWIPYSSVYFVLSRFGNPSRLKPGKQSIGMVESMRAPPAGMLTNWTHIHKHTQRPSFILLHLRHCNCKILHMNASSRRLNLVVFEEGGGADGVEEDTIRTPAEFVAKRIV